MDRADREDGHSPGWPLLLACRSFSHALRAQATRFASHAVLPTYRPGGPPRTIALHHVLGDEGRMQVPARVSGGGPTRRDPDVCHHRYPGEIRLSSLFHGHLETTSDLFRVVLTDLDEDLVMHGAHNDGARACERLREVG